MDIKTFVSSLNIIYFWGFKWRQKFGPSLVHGKATYLARLHYRVKYTLTTPACSMGGVENCLHYTQEMEHNKNKKVKWWEDRGVKSWGITHDPGHKVRLRNTLEEPRTRNWAHGITPKTPKITSWRHRFDPQWTSQDVAPRYWHSTNEVRWRWWVNTSTLSPSAVIHCPFHLCLFRHQRPLSAA